MDEERSAAAISREPPDDGDPGLPAPQPSSQTSSNAERENSCPSPQPCPGDGKKEVVGKKTKEKKRNTNILHACHEGPVFTITNVVIVVEAVFESSEQLS